ncbi:hypothetical protein GGI20_000969 [Coemansia sp. BCRC 34301]|nr:hypothetical protein GGI20_000969 [Coemansia sp. BCRC 34301]
MYVARLGLVAASIATVVTAHMAIISPCPRYSPQGKNCPALPAGQSLDYSMTSPLSANSPLCKHIVPFPTLSATWTAGQSVTVEFMGSATHGGGHCEFSLSYDGGKTFVVVYQVLGRCFGADEKTRQYSFDLPKGLPTSSKAVFAWSWVNAIGNREFYMNCADVAIKGGSEPFTGKQMTIANLNGYPSIPEFRGNYETGLEHYGKKTITVTSDGSTVSEQNPDEQQQPPPPEEEPSKKPTSSSAVNNSQPTNADDNGGYIVQFMPFEEGEDEDNPVVDNKPALRSGCPLGTFRCGTDTSKFDTCDNLGWVSRPCAPGTVCRITGADPNPCQLP